MATVYIGQAVCSWSAPVSGGAVVTYTTKFGTASGGPYPTTYAVSAPTLSVRLQTANPSLGTFFSVVTASNAAGESAPSNEVQYTAIADVLTVAYRYTLVQFAGR